jgi:ribonucleoside-diphosphate reductase alpha chain
MVNSRFNTGITLMVIEVKHFEGQKEKPWYVIMNDDDKFTLEKFTSKQDAYEFYQTIKNNCIPLENRPTSRNSDSPEFSEYTNHYLSGYVKVVCKLNTWRNYTVKDIWEMIVRNAHATAEPGICFIDRANEDNPTPNLGRIEASNPCGEQPLLPYEACNLGSINVAKVFNEDRSDLNWDSLAETVKCSVRFLDNVIDANHFPIPEIERITHGNRKVGLGIMGFADTLILLGIRYGSDEAIHFAKKSASFIQEHAHKASEELAKKRGCFPNWQGSIWDTNYHRPMRNAAVTTIAPTGTISLIAGCSSGIEPIFDIVPKRRALDGQEFLQLTPLIEELGTKEGWLSENVRNRLLEGVPPTEISEIPKRLSEVLITAHQISPEWHVRIQVAFQKYTDNAVSKTVNLPASATVEDVDKVYRRAYELRCKGITVYRDQSRQNQVITSASKETKFATNLLSPRPRPKKTTGKTIKSRTGCGTLFITVNKDINGLCEVFANLGKAGGCPSQSEATCRIISAALRCGVDAKVLIEQLKNIRCFSTVTRRKEDKDIDVLSCPDAIARAIEEVLGENRESVKTSSINKCPECGHPLRREEGCNVCDNCSYRKCG